MKRLEEEYLDARVRLGLRKEEDGAFEDELEMVLKKQVRAGLFDGLAEAIWYDADEVTLQDLCERLDSAAAQILGDACMHYAVVREVRLAGFGPGSPTVLLGILNAAYEEAKNRALALEDKEGMSSACLDLARKMAAQVGCSHK